jgi:alpha-methylacyl-CoA racemase
MAGPLSGVRIIELAGIGPVPFAGMMLADHGADVIRVERPGEPARRSDPLARSRRSVTLDLKTTSGVARFRRLCSTADGLIEGFRPGVMERLGLGPDILLADRPALIYGRMTGWGQDGPYAAKAGHDINYIAISGVLGACGRTGEKPVPPLNLVGDFGAGGMMLAFGMVSALLAAKSGGKGQVIDCAMTDGAALLMALIWGLRAQGAWQDKRGVNALDGGAPFYEVYETAEGGYIALGAIEEKFYATLCNRLGIAEDPIFNAQYDQSLWPEQKRKLTALFLTKSRGEWCELLKGADACFSPVLTMSECLEDSHNRARKTFIEIGGTIQPAPVPRYSITRCDLPKLPTSIDISQGFLPR